MAAQSAGVKAAWLAAAPKWQSAASSCESVMQLLWQSAGEISAKSAVGGYREKGGGGGGEKAEKTHGNGAAASIGGVAGISSWQYPPGSAICCGSGLQRQRNANISVSRSCLESSSAVSNGASAWRGGINGRHRLRRWRERVSWRRRKIS